MNRFLLFILTALSASAASTYYIDWETGNDGNAGTQGSPWKRCPGMTGWAGSHTVAAGDRFIFKGGVTWPQMQVSVSTSGNSGAWIYYGMDATWYNGGSWTRPKIDGEWTTGRQFSINARYIVIDGLELLNARLPNDSGSIQFSGDYLTFTNLYIHGWDMYSSTDGQNGGICGPSSGGYDHTLMTHCEVACDDGVSTHHYGCGAYCIHEVAFCKIHDVTDGVQKGVQLIHDNELYNFGHPTIGGTHCDVTYLAHWNYSDCYFYNNYVHGDVSDAMIVYCTGWGSGTKNWWIYNNLIISDNVGGVATVWQTLDGNSNYDLHSYVYNNTIINVGGMVIFHIGDSGTAGTVRGWNNVLMSGGGYGDYTAIATNLLYSSLGALQSAGFATNAYYQPSSGSAPSVGAAMNLSSLSLPGFAYDSSVAGYRTQLSHPSVGAWDIGAYQYSGSAPSSAQIQVSPSSQNWYGVRTNTTGSNATFTVSNTGNTNLVGFASVPAPFVISGTGTNYTLAPGTSTNFTATFAPTAVGDVSASIDFTGGGAASSVLSGRGMPLLSTNQADPTAAVLDYPIVAGAGSNYIENTDTLGLHNGFASYTFDAAVLGIYKVSANVMIFGGGSNSVFIDIDHVPVDVATRSWDVNSQEDVADGATWYYPDGVWTNLCVGWRGSGTSVNPQYRTNYWSLEAGPHTLWIRGREPGMRVKEISITTDSTPPAVPTPTGVRITGNSVIRGNGKMQ